MERWEQSAPWIPGGRVRPRVIELNSLTTLRFVAALLVFLRHEMALTRFWPSYAFPFDAGFVGVSFFFVLSGFVLAWSARPDGGATGFYKRRFARVYPLHIATWALAFVMIDATDSDFSMWAAVLALFMLQAWVPTQTVFWGMNGVSWSLSCEAMFYSIFPPLHARLAGWSTRRRWITALVAIGACQAIAIPIGVAGGQAADAAAYVNPGLRAGEFILGLVLGIEMARGWVPRLRGRTALLASAVFVVATYRVWQIDTANVRLVVLDALMLVPFTLAIVWFATADIEGRRSILRSRPGVYLGKLSYAFYLTHAMVAVMTMEIIGLPRTFDGALARLGLDLSVAIGASIVLHHAIEVPVRRLILARRIRTQGAQAPIPAPAQVGAAGAPA